MVWMRLGTYTATIEEAPELYDMGGAWIELLRDPPEPRSYAKVEIGAEVLIGAYWYVTEDLTNIAVSRLHVTPTGCRHEPWLVLSKSAVAPATQAQRVRRAFARADDREEPAPRFLRRRLVRASMA